MPSMGRNLKTPPTRVRIRSPSIRAKPCWDCGGNDLDLLLVVNLAEVSSPKLTWELLQMGGPRGAWAYMTIIRGVRRSLSECI